MSRQKLKYATNQQMVLDIRPKAAHNIPPEASRLSFNSIVPVNEANCFNIKFVHQPSSTARMATQRALNTTSQTDLKSTNFIRCCRCFLSNMRQQVGTGKREKKAGKGNTIFFRSKKKTGKEKLHFFILLPALLHFRAWKVRNF